MNIKYMNTCSCSTASRLLRIRVVGSAARRGSRSKTSCDVGATLTIAFVTSHVANRASHRYLRFNLQASRVIREALLSESGIL